MNRRLLLAVTSIGAAAAALGGGAAVSKAVAAAPASYVQGEALVRFAEGTSLASVQAAHQAVGATVVRSFNAVPNLQLVRFDGLSVSEAVARYEARSGVRYAQPNYLYQPLATPNDPRFPEMWQLHNTGQTGGTADADVDAPEAWEEGTGTRKVAVGVLDTGTDYTHPDLAANTKANKAECNGRQGRDDDSNGYVDDCHGIDARMGDTDPADPNGHGTHTGGTIGAVGDNGVGVTGMSWKVTVVACKIFDQGGSNGTAAAIIECLEYMELLKADGLDVIATSNSYRGCTEACDFDQATHDAIESNMEAGILFVAAAGNGGGDNDVNPGYPTNYFLPNVISVAATDHNDNKAGFSDFGDRTVHLGAPGVNTLSTVPNNGYARFSGTSMAAPHVGGLAGLLKGQDRSRDWIAIRNLILAGGDDKPSMATTTITGKRMNANGSATCSNKRMFGVLRPLDTQAGKTIPIAAVNINCAEPAAGALSVTIRPGNVKVNLKDDGTGADQVADDGTFSGRWKPRPCRPRTYTFEFSNGEEVSANITC
jgi:subtilisin family serine protease